MITSPPVKFYLLLLLLLFVVRRGESEEYQCGEQAGGKRCREGLCCSIWGHCGDTDDYCGEGNCQIQCPDEGLTSVISREQFEEMLLHRNDERCRAQGVYTYEAFIEAAKSFPEFGNVGNDTTRKRDIAAFLAQTSYTTNAGWPEAPDGPYSWGYCLFPPYGPTYCVTDDRWPCVPGKRYFPRGPFRLQYNYNYGQVGEALGLDDLLLSEPDLVATDGVISFKTAIYIWMTSRSNKPSCHDVMSGKWVPSESDINAGRVPGYGVTINILNGVRECGTGIWNIDSEYRMGFYRRYCDILGIDHGDYLDCYNQQPFGPDLFRASI